ncbi:uncharacterized protein LOC113396593 [Vanessa tameamea]|uniref:Uncharacterized protein LOC113396593 n=1 Tax=Vanessa tameamea TaxID=334116 RepID=A0A8B8I1T2_VANTA
MSNFAKTPQKRKSNYRNINSTNRETNNNTNTQHLKQESAKKLIVWYKQLVDNDRQKFSLFLSDDVTLEWFGRTIKTRKKVAAFVKNDIQCSRHDFTTVQSIEKIETRNERLHRNSENILISPLHSPETTNIPKTQKSGKRKIQTTCNSPQWAEGCKPNDDDEIECKRKKSNINFGVNEQRYHIRENPEVDVVISNNGDGITEKCKHKSSSITPPNVEYGQGDCLPSTSGTGSESSHEALNAQLPKLAVECDGYVEFNRTRNSRSSDCMKWDRKCKVQISYSEDPLNIGEYIIWALRYSDESKCRRNLLAAFEEAASD